MRQEDVFPAIITAVQGDSAILALLGSASNIMPVYVDLPTVFPALGLYFRERGSKKRPGYDIFKYRDCNGELTAFIQNKTTSRDTILVKSALDNLLSVTGITGTWGWKILDEDNRIGNPEKLQGIAHYKQVIYTFEYTVTDV